MGVQRRFLFSSTSGNGHFHPLAPLAQALAGRGHEVAFAGSALLQPKVAAAGFEFFRVGQPRDLDPQYREFRAQVNALPLSLESEIFSYPRMFGAIGAKLTAPSFVEAAKRWQADMVIREGGEYGSVIAAEHLGLPLATVSFAAALLTMPVFERELPQLLAPVRESWGLPPDPGLTAPYRYLYLAYAPPSFAKHEVGRPGLTAALPATTRYIRPAIFDQSGDERLPDWIDALPAQPTVYLTLGTEVNKEPELYPSVLQTLIVGLRELPVNLIVTLGRGKDPAEFGPQPDNVHIEPYIPQSLLLPHCDLMVMHGGSNSVLAALDLGMPVVVVPLIADQFFNAYVTDKMQLGRVVQREELTPERIRAAAADALNNPLYRQNAARLQTELHALPGQEYAVELIERVAATREPIDA